MLKHLNIGFALILLCGPAMAQSESRTVKFRVLCYEHVKDTLKGFVMVGGSDKKEIEFFTGGFGPQNTGSFKGNKAIFFVEKPGPDGKVVPVVIAEGNLASSASQVFLLLPETKSNGRIYRVLAFDDGEKSFPMGSTRVINLTTFENRLNLAGKDFSPIKPGGMAVYPLVKAVDDWNMFTVRIDFLAKQQWIPVSTQSWKASDRKRDWVITQLEPGSQSPVIRLYQDIPPWREVKLNAKTEE